MLNGMGGVVIKNRRIFKGALLLLLISFFTLFLNIEVLPYKLSKKNTIDAENVASIVTRDIKSLESPPISPQQKIRKGEPQTSPQKVNIQNAERSKEFALFKVISNPFVPSYILQGNYGINAQSPQGDFTAYLYPDEWETVGDIYLKDRSNAIWSCLQLDQLVRWEMWNTQEPIQMKYTPKKKILWLNNEEFLVVIGYAYGTVSTGGDCIKVNKQTGRAQMVYPAHQMANQEVADIDISEGKLFLRINVFDPNGLSIIHKAIAVDLDNFEVIQETAHDTLSSSKN